jgi:hypothetical protein
VRSEAKPHLLSLANAVATSSSFTSAKHPGIRADSPRCIPDNRFSGRPNYPPATYLFKREYTMSMSNSDSFIEPAMSSSDADEIDSLPSSATSSSVDDDEYISDADREWRESLQQMELLLTMVLVPYIGKYFGRKCAYWGTSSYGHDRTMNANHNCRMGEVDGVELPGPDCHVKPEDIQAGRSD